MYSVDIVVSTIGTVLVCVSYTLYSTVCTDFWQVETPFLVQVLMAPVAGRVLNSQLVPLQQQQQQQQHRQQI